jgi:hypothetical protein
LDEADVDIDGEGTEDGKGVGKSIMVGRDVVGLSILYIRLKSQKVYHQRIDASSGKCIQKEKRASTKPDSNLKGSEMGYTSPYLGASLTSRII